MSSLSIPVSYLLACRSQGVIALDDWVSQCIAYLTTTGAISNNSNETKVLDAVLRVYLDSDIYITKDEFNQLPQNINVSRICFNYFCVWIWS